MFLAWTLVWLVVISVGRREMKSQGDWDPSSTCKTAEFKL